MRVFAAETLYAPRVIVMMAAAERPPPIIRTQIDLISSTKSAAGWLCAVHADIARFGGTCVECHKLREAREGEPGVNVNEISHDQGVETYSTQPKTPVRGAQSK